MKKRILRRILFTLVKMKKRATKQQMAARRARKKNDDKRAVLTSTIRVSEDSEVIPALTRITKKHKGKKSLAIQAAIKFYDENGDK